MKKDDSLLDNALVTRVAHILASGLLHLRGEMEIQISRTGCALAGQ